MITNITPEASKAIQMTSYDTSQQTRMLNCIGRYTAPKNFSGKMKYIAFRVWNAVKALFGQSEWQKTVNTMANSTTAEMSQKLISVFQSKAEHLEGTDKKDFEKGQRLILSTFRKIASLVANQMLLDALYKNGGLNQKPDMNAVQKAVESTIQESQKRIQQLYPNLQGVLKIPNQF